MHRMFFAQNTPSIVIPSFTFGRLYNAYAYRATNFAPSGFHVATKDDWAVLGSYLGGSTVAGNKVREVGTTHWTSPNSGATNSSGLTLLGNGLRDRTAGAFYSLMDVGYLAAVTTDTNYWVTFADYASAYMITTTSTDIDGRTGLAVRMVKDATNSTTPSYIMDYEGNVYGTIVIGTQMWITQNWKSAKYNDGTSIPNVTDNAIWGTLSTGAMCAYNNDEGNV